MLTKLIILRGNSGSGKTTTAHLLRQALSPKTTMLVSQDLIRLEILNVKDFPENPSVQLIPKICKFGNNRYDYVILEGILDREKYQTMLSDLLEFFDNNTLVYYFDISFSETLKRNDQHAADHRFSKELLEKWWLDKDFLAVSSEHQLAEDLTQKEIIQQILIDLRKNSKFLPHHSPK